MSPRDRLATQIESALAEYHAVSGFSAEEWPKLSQAFADLVHSSTHVHSGCEGPREVAYNAQQYARDLADFHAALAEVVE